MLVRSFAPPSPSTAAAGLSLSLSLPVLVYYPMVQHRSLAAAADHPANETRNRRRRDMAVQIRKQRHDAVLRRKRGQQSQQQPSGGASAAVGDNNNNNNTSIPMATLSVAVTAFVDHPQAVDRLEALARALSSTVHRETIRAALDPFLRLPAPLSTTAAAVSSTSVLDRCVGSFLVAALMQHLLHEATRHAALSAILEITSSSSSSTAIVTSSTATATSSSSSFSYANYGGNDNNRDDYYGNAPLSWTDLFLEQPNNLIDILLSLIHQQSQQASSLAVIPVVTCFHILGNLVQDSPDSVAWKAMLPHWSSVFVPHLPSSIYGCAALIQHSSTQYAMKFLAPMLSSSPSSSFWLSESVWMADEIANDAAWILEGLSRREDEAVHALCRLGCDGGGVGTMEEDGAMSDTTTIKAPFLALLLQAIVHHSSGVTDGGGGGDRSSTRTNAAFLVPALRAVCNLMTACRGQYASWFSQNELFVPIVNRLLEDETPTTTLLMDGISVAGAAMLPLPRPRRWRNSSTDFDSWKIVASHVVPRLVAILTGSRARLEWKREAAWAIAGALVASRNDSNNTNNDDTTRATLMDLIGARTQSESSRIALMDSLIAMSQVPDKDAVLPSLQILDCLLRHSNDNNDDGGSSRRRIFESCGGVDALEHVCADCNELDPVSQIAANLIDDFFDDDEEEEAGDVISDQSGAVNAFDMVNTASRTFAFQASGLEGPFNFDPSSTWSLSTAPSDPSASSLPPIGRGRGRTMPAWMIQQQ